MPHTDNLNGLFQPALGVCLLLSCALSHAQEADRQEDGAIKNPKECLQTELVWARDDNSTVNSLVSDYFFSYPEGIKLTNRCDETVSTKLGVDAVMGGIVEDITSPGGGITNVETTSEEVLECEWFSTFLTGGDTTVLEFPERARETAERYHYERASHIASNPDEPDYWENLGWQHVRYQGCAEWSDARMKIGTGYRHTCPVGICPGEAFTVTADYLFSGEVVQESETSQHVVKQEQEVIAVTTEPKCPFERKHHYQGSTYYDYWIRNGRKNEKACWVKIPNKDECFFYMELAPYQQERDTVADWTWNSDNTDGSEPFDWSGECSNGVATGKGTFVDYYELWTGEFLNGKRHGQWTHDTTTGWEHGDEATLQTLNRKYGTNYTLTNTVNYKNGERHGLTEKVECFAAEEICISKTNYQNGVRHGISENWRIDAKYWENVRLTRKETWENGERTSGGYLDLQLYDDGLREEWVDY